VIQRTAGTEAILGGQQVVNAAVLSDDGRLVAAGDGTGRIVLWNAQTLRPIGNPIQLPGEGGIIGLAIDPTRTWLGSLLASSGQGSVWLVKLTGDREAREVGQFVGPWLLTFADGGALLVGASPLEGVSRTWNVTTGRQEGRDVALEVPSRGGINLARNGEAIAVGRRDAVVLVEADSGRMIRTIKTQVAIPLSREPSSPVALSADARMLATVNDAGTVTIWDTASGKRQTMIESGASDPSHVALSADGSRIVIGRENASVQVYDSATGVPMGPPFEGHAGPLTGLDFASKGGRFATSGRDGLVIL
jgi:DNA-binding beta-propeller fold protein YncE